MKFTAPCGHPGEPIIGTHVKCLQGCDEKPVATTFDTKPALLKPYEVKFYDSTWRVQSNCWWDGKSGVIQMTADKPCSICSYSIRAPGIGTAVYSIGPFHLVAGDNLGVSLPDVLTMTFW